MNARRAARILLVLSPAIGLAAAGVWYAVRQFDPAPPPRQPGGRLVVLAVFDQMRGDYPDRWAALFGPDGFERLKQDGVWFADAHLPYACTSTGPGHASIATGAPPAVHGIVENEWYDRARGKKVYCSTGDRPYERVPLNPAAGSRAKDGGGLAPDRLLAPTVADQLRTSTAGKGRAFSLALKDRAAVLMGGKEPAGCYCFDPASGQFHTSAYYRDRVHPWVDRFNTSGAADQWFGKDWTRLGEAVLYDRFAGPDDAPGEADGPGRTFPHHLGKNLTAPGGRYYAALEASPYGNELLWDLAKSAIEGEKLGRGEAADLLCLGFSANDAVGHAWGPDSHEVLDATLRSDRLVGEMLKYLTDAVGPGRFALVVTSDHGVCPLPEKAVKDHPEADRFAPAGEFGPLGEALDDAFGRPDAGGRWVESLDFPWVYLNRRLTADRGVPPAEVEAVAAEWLGNRAVSVAAYGRAALAGPPLGDAVGRSVQASYRPDRSGDLYILTKPYLIPTGKGSTGTTHGSPYPYDTHVPILAYGVGVPRWKKRPERVNALLVAPIVCRALGIDPPGGAAEKLPAGFD